jgi:hypothetical protein
MGKLSSWLKIGQTIVPLDSTSKSGLRTSSNISKSASSARMGLPNAQQAQLFPIKTIKYKS